MNQNITIQHKNKLYCFLKERKKLSYKAIDFSLISLFILYMANCLPNTIMNSYFALVALIYTIGVFVYRRRKFDTVIVVFLFVWVLINFISGIRNSISDLPASTYISRTIKMVIPYFLIKSVGRDFFEKFFNYAYVLVVFSLPLFLLSIIVPPVFSVLTPVFSFMTNPLYAEHGGFYLFVFMYQDYDYIGALRNSGFMWEPGAFAGMLIFMLYYYWFRVEIVFDKKIFVILAALITTFSTSGFFALFFALLLYVLQNRKLKKFYFLIPVFLVVVLYASVRVYNESEFMSGKVATYLEQGTEHWGVNADGALRLSRLGIILVSLDDLLHYPFGNGFLLSDYIIHTYSRVEGPSAIASLLREWGVLAVVMLVMMFRYWAKIFNQKTLAGVMYAISISFLLFSNPDGYKFLIYSIFFFAFIYKDKPMNVNLKMIDPRKRNYKSRLT